MKNMNKKIILFKIQFYLKENKQIEEILNKTFPKFETVENCYDSTKGKLQKSLIKIINEYKLTTQNIFATMKATKYLQP